MYSYIISYSIFVCIQLFKNEIRLLKLKIVVKNIVST
jgi:hypothetical protein